eukprot:4657448-Amphidinium_carterae.1
MQVECSFTGHLNDLRDRSLVMHLGMSELSLQASSTFAQHSEISACKEVWAALSRAGPVHVMEVYGGVGG